MVTLGLDAPYEGRENKLQESVIRYLRIMNMFCIHVPNGGFRNKIEAFNLKRQGVLSGCPDILIFDRHIAIELKVKGNKVTENQKEFMSQLEEVGWFCIVAYNLECIINFFEKK